MKVLVITGGIGSGKSTVCRMLTEIYQIPVYEADKRAKELYDEVPSMLEDIETSLSVTLRDESGKFVPKFLSDIIFHNPEALSKVEDLLFPVMKEDFSIWAEKQACGVVVFESATVLEKPQFREFGDIVLLVDAPVAQRLNRAMRRDGADESDVMKRIEAQPLMNRLSDGMVNERVDFVLKNDSTHEELEVKTREFMEICNTTKLL